MDRPDTETLDKLYLEWSQFTQAKTKREIHLESERDRLRERVRELEGCSHDAMTTDINGRLICPMCKKILFDADPYPVGRTPPVRTEE